MALKCRKIAALHEKDIYIYPLPLLFPLVSNCTLFLLNRLFIHYQRGFIHLIHAIQVLHLSPCQCHHRASRSNPLQ